MRSGRCGEVADGLGIYNGKQVLVTGDTGFKGSWLSVWLHELGADVIGLGLMPKTKDDNFSVCKLWKNVQHVHGDVRDYSLVLSVIDEYEPDVIFHLAGQALTLDAYTDPLGTFRTNVIGTANVLEAVRECGTTIAAVMITSDKCYENYEHSIPYTETDRLGGKDPYSASKAAAEIVISAYRRSFFSNDKTAIASARAGNVVGGGDWSKNRLIPDCIRAIQNKEPIIVRNPDSVRPWQYVLEPLYGYLVLGSRLYMHGYKYAEPWNFAPTLTKDDTVKKVVDLVIRYSGDGSYRTIPDNSSKECGLLILDSMKANARLGWKPVLSLDDTIRMTVDDYRIDGLTSDQVYERRVRRIKEYTKLRGVGK